MRLNYLAHSRFSGMPAETVVKRNVSEYLSIVEIEGAKPWEPHKFVWHFPRITSNTGSSAPGELTDDLEHVGGGGLLLKQFA